MPQPDRAAREAPELGVERLVDLEIADELLDLAHTEAFHLGTVRPQPGELGRFAVALGREPRGDPLEGTADLDRVPDVG